MPTGEQSHEAVGTGPIETPVIVTLQVLYSKKKKKRFWSELCGYCCMRSPVMQETLIFWIQI